MQELHRESFGRDGEIITVGEMSSTSMENCFRYAGAESGELTMVFSFHHLKVDFVGNEKWVLVPANFGKLKEILFSWQTGMAQHNAWNAVFWCNHDQPRVVSRFGDEGEYWKESAKMLAGVIHGMRGTPYIYQGEELGMTNANFSSIAQYRDVESLNHYQILRDKGMSEESVLSILKVHSRDNSRTPMQWDATEQGGFTTGEIWIAVNPNTVLINAAAQQDDPNSIFAYYQSLIRLRKTYDVFSRGDFIPVDEKNPSILAYRRTYQGNTLLCVNNFYRKPCTWQCHEDLTGYRVLLSNYADAAPAKSWQLRPYESVFLYREN